MIHLDIRKGRGSNDDYEGDNTEEDNGSDEHFKFVFGPKGLFFDFVSLNKYN